MSEVQVFNHPEFGQHLVRLDQAGNGVFILSPIAKALDYRDAEKAVRLLDRDEYWVETIDLPTPERGTSQVRRRVTMISESGLYHLIIKSTKPEAKAFRRWVTGELLPTVRKAQEVGIDVVEELKAKIEDLKQEKEMADIEAASASEQLSYAFRLGWYARKSAPSVQQHGYDPYNGGIFTKVPSQLGWHSSN